MFNRLRLRKYRLPQEELQEIKRYIYNVQLPPEPDPPFFYGDRHSLDFCRRYNSITDIPNGLAAFLLNGCDGYDMFHWFDLPSHIGPSFRHVLSMMIHQYGSGQICQHAGISRRTYYSLFDQNYQPSKDLVLRIAIGSQLSLGYANLLLNRAGYSLETTCDRDLIVDYCLQECIYDVYTVNDALRRLGQRPLARK